MHRQSDEDQGEYLRRTGVLSLLNSCVSELSRYRPPDPAVFLSVLLARRRGLALSVAELTDFVKSSDKAHPALLLRTLQLSCPADADLSSPDWSNVLHRSADLLAKLCVSVPQLQELEASLQHSKVPPLVQLALVLARCKLVVRDIKRPHRITVVVPLHCCSKALRHPSQSPQGEGVVQLFHEQMGWLLDGHESITWDVMFVDELCPEGSGAVARRQARDLGISHKMSVVSLYDGIMDDAVAAGTNLPPSHWLRDCCEVPLVCGGALAFGMHKAAALSGGSDSHVVVLAPPTTASHLAQVGLLLEDLSSNAVVCADMMHAKASPRQKVSRADRLFAFLWHRFLPLVSGVYPVSRPYIAMRASLARELAPQMTIRYNPLFSLELCIRSALRKGNDRIGRVPFMSFGRIYQPETFDYPIMLRDLADCGSKIAHDYPAASDAYEYSVEWVEFCRTMTASKWAHALETPAADIVANPGYPDGMPVQNKHSCPPLDDFKQGEAWEEEQRRKREEEEAVRLRQEEERKQEEERLRKERRRRSKR